VEGNDLSSTSNPSGPAAGTADPATTVHRFTATLLGRYQALRDAGAALAPDRSAIDERLTELLLAEAALRYARPRAGRGRPPQLAVLGPTQTGKSTVVNLILNAPVADVSPLAGFTTHPQGFWTGTEALDAGWTAELFPGWQRRAVNELSRDELECYALAALDGTVTRPAGLPACVVWDTPDFDSLAARAYRRGVLEVAALADVHLFVLSKEKYSDLSVWRMLRLLQRLARPLVICLNKLTPDAIETVTASLKQRLAELSGPAAGAPIITFEYHPGLGDPADVNALPELWELRDRVAIRLKAAHATTRDAGVAALLRQHWSDWTAPIETEIAALRAWDELVAAALDQALAAYRRDFLEHPQRFDTFRRATVELLHLLELPGFANVLSQVRHVLSWPARRLFAARQAWLARRRTKTGLPHGLGSEEVVLFQIIEKLLTGLGRDAARRCDPTPPGSAVWRALAARLHEQEHDLRASFQAAAQKQREDFAPVIHATANRLYETLQKRPALLNTLRATRATTELASIALVIKTGGLGLNDLLFAPAMFAVTSILTEGALGSYMQHIANDLKKQQAEHVRATLMEGVFAARLRDLATDLRDPGLFGVSAEQLQAATQALEAWEPCDDE
jgi:hypothetical protein